MRYGIFQRYNSAMSFLSFEKKILLFFAGTFKTKEKSSIEKQRLFLLQQSAIVLSIKRTVQKSVTPSAVDHKMLAAS